MYFGEYYIAAQEVTSNVLLPPGVNPTAVKNTYISYHINYVYVLYYILCVDKDYIFGKVKFYLTRLCSSCISTLPRFGATVAK
jgi:hypothetical protein